MNFFKRIGVLIYAMLMICAGGLFLLVSLNIFPTERWTELLGVVYGTLGYQIALGSVGGLFVVIGVSAPFRFAKKIRRNRVIAFQNPDGEVTVSLSAIEDYVRKVAKDIPGIDDIRSSVIINRKGINIISDVSISAGSNIPEVTENIQMMVKNKVQGMLGVEEKINIKMNIKKIMKGAQPEEIPAQEEMEERVPFRNMG